MSESVAVWGAKGNTGRELVAILAGHPNVGDIQTVGREFPEETDHIGTAFLAISEHGESAKLAAKLQRSGRKIIDISGDLRFPDPADYERWYRQPHPAPELLPAPYALPEWADGFADDVDIVSMPGCYPTATLLSVRPLIQAGLLAPETRLHVNAQSGLSGRGRKPVGEIHYGNTVLYNPGYTHRHIGEMEQFTSGHSINFVPSTVDTYRGMLVTTTAELADDVTTNNVHEVLHDAYDEKPFVHVLSVGEIPTFKTGAGTDGCYIGAIAANGCLTVISSIDNLRKGAASQAVQAFNMLHGYDEAAGLTPNQPAQYTTSCR